MKKMLFVLAILASFVSYSQSKISSRTTFLEDLEAMKNFTDQQMIELKDAKNTADSLTILNAIKGQADALASKWDISEEMERTPFGAAFCTLWCAGILADCLSTPGYQGFQCLNIYRGCRVGQCGLPDFLTSNLNPLPSIKPKHTFKQDMEALRDFVDSKMIALRSTTSSLDSITILNSIKAQMAILSSQWDVEEEMKTAPDLWGPVSAALCQMYCLSVYISCSKSGTSQSQCMAIYRGCLGVECGYPISYPTVLSKKDNSPGILLSSVKSKDGPQFLLNPQRKEKGASYSTIL